MRACLRVCVPACLRACVPACLRACLLHIIPLPAVLLFAAAFCRCATHEFHDRMFVGVPTPLLSSYTLATGSSDVGGTVEVQGVAWLTYGTLVRIATSFASST